MVGLLLDKTNLDTRINALTLPHIKSSPSISNADVARSYLGLLCQGKHDFDHIEAFRQDEFFSLALHLSHVPSSPTLRQRLNQLAQTNRYSSLLLEESADLLRTIQVCPTPITLEGPPPSRSYVPLDIDVSAFDNSGTKKEGVSRTYKGIDGYSPAFAYLGQEGDGVHVQLREGKDHCQNQAPSFLAESIRYAKRVTDQRLLVRMDSGYDCQENIKV